MLILIIDQVSGKPGSGKSTLMKFLADHETTRKILEEWASESNLIIASHYFWSAGTQMQKCHEGFYRTLLYDIFRLYPLLIRQLCPFRWSQAGSASCDNATSWTTSELLDTLRALSRHESLPARFCLFIDGIDEFDGDHLKLCELLVELARSPNIKFCLASRPWNVFIDAFGNGNTPGIRIEDLTRHDIQEYTKSRLSEHPRWNICHFRAQEKQSIINDITSKAQGVFLWVFLVTNSFRDGLTNGDTMLDLRRRLESLPTDLELFFKHILDLIDPIYHEKMAACLSIAVNAKHPLPFLIYSMHEHEYEDEDYAVKLAPTPISETELAVLRDHCYRRINARCGGLLDMKHDSIEFLHRTVRDFLFTGEMSVYFKEKLRRGFSTDLSTFRAYVAILKRNRQLAETIFQDSMQSLLWEALQFANNSMQEFEDTVFDLIDHLEKLYQPMSDENESLPDWDLISVSDGGYCEARTSFGSTSPHLHFREELLQAGVEEYVFKKLLETPVYFDHLNELPLNVVIRQHTWTTRNVQVMHHLLESGQDPNARQDLQHTSTPWVHFIKSTCKENFNLNFQVAVENELFSLFLRRGAYRNLLLEPVVPSKMTFSNARFRDSPHWGYGKHDGSQNNEVPRLVIQKVPKREPKTPCAYFLQAALSYGAETKLENKIISILDEFLDLNFKDSLDIAILFTLQDEIQAMDPKDMRLRQLRFSAQLAEKVITVGRALGWDMEFLVNDVERIFPGMLGMGMLNLIIGTRGDRQEGPSSREKDSDNSTSSKRKRPERTTTQKRKQEDESSSGARKCQKTQMGQRILLLAPDPDSITDHVVDRKARSSLLQAQDSSAKDPKLHRIH